MSDILSHEDLLKQIESSWNELLNYLASLTEEQLTRPTDAAGWTVKDHIMHIAAWEIATLALLEGKSKREAMNIPFETWVEGDDPINALLYQRYQSMPLDEVMQALRDNHEPVMKKLNSMTEDDLLLPHRHYQLDSSDERPLLEWLKWETIHHYKDHLSWIPAIVM